MMLYRLLLALCLGASVGCAGVENKPDVDTKLQIVDNYIAAFNAQDTDAMLSMLTDDVQWLSVDGEKITIETNSKEELRSAMVDYFNSCSSCKSRLEHVFSSGSRVSALEVASYETSKGLQEQKSVSLYEFSGALINRVYYFPAEK